MVAVVVAEEVSVALVAGPERVAAVASLAPRVRLEAFAFLVAVELFVAVAGLAAAAFSWFSFRYLQRVAEVSFSKYLRRYILQTTWRLGREILLTVLPFAEVSLATLAEHSVYVVATNEQFWQSSASSLDNRHHFATLHLAPDVESVAVVVASQPFARSLVVAVVAPCC